MEFSQNMNNLNPLIKYKKPTYTAGFVEGSEDRSMNSQAHSSYTNQTNTYCVAPTAHTTLTYSYSCTQSTGL